MEKQIYDAKKTNDAIVSPIKYITTPTHVPNPPAKIYKNAQVSQLNTKLGILLIVCTPQLLSLCIHCF